MVKDTGIVERVQRAIDRVRDFGEGKDEEYGTATAVIREATEAIAEARTACVNVSDLKSQLPELEQKARRFYADKAVDRVHKIGEGRLLGYITPDSAIREARNAIAEAKSVGVAVLDLESMMPEAEQKAWRFFARKSSKPVC